LVNHIVGSVLATPLSATPVGRGTGCLFCDEGRRRAEAPRDTGLRWLRSARLAQEAEGASGRVIYFRPNNSGSFATLAAIRHASSFVSNLAADRPLGVEEGSCAKNMLIFRSLGKLQSPVVRRPKSARKFGNRPYSGRRRRRQIRVCLDHTFRCTTAEDSTFRRLQ
jgi:hypothetical protein